MTFIAGKLATNCKFIVKIQIGFPTSQSIQILRLKTRNIRANLIILMKASGNECDNETVLQNLCEK